ncbi:MFS transporter [Kosakonia sp. S42]|uniref:MFS transporter n=1 Tax=Kosakonia sp. S42 TaxID=2767458 RepID=UPI00190A2F0F|nr:MFS transporter [Kosakonia sp. S42]MBK0015669.1 MFS transporter [Kosakonia sp. S42]
MKKNLTYIIGSSSLNHPYCCLFFTSLILTVARGITLPFLVVFLHLQRGLGIDETGYIITAGIMLGLFCSSLCGKVIKALNYKRSIILAMLLFSTSNVATSEFQNPVLIILFYALLNVAYSLYSVVLKLAISGAQESHKSRLFSVNYTMTNVGWVIGPLLGSFFSNLDGRMAFWISGVIGILIALFFTLYKVGLIEDKEKKEDIQCAAVVRGNRNHSINTLCLIILAGFIYSFCYGRFSSSITQVLTVIFDRETTYKIIMLLMVTNALFVIIFQIPLGSRVSKDNICLSSFIGSCGVIIGVMLFAGAGGHFTQWIAGMIFFSLGEILLNPVLYLMLDSLKTNTSKASLFSLQMLTGMGAAINPAATGWFVKHVSSGAIFMVIAFAAVIGFFLVTVALKDWRKYA